MLMAFQGFERRGLSALAQIDDEFWFVAPEVTSLHEDAPVRVRALPPSTCLQSLSFPCLPMLVSPLSK